MHKTYESCKDHYPLPYLYIAIWLAGLVLSVCPRSSKTTIKIPYSVSGWFSSIDSTRDTTYHTISSSMVNAFDLRVSKLTVENLDLVNVLS